MRESGLRCVLHGAEGSEIVFQSAAPFFHRAAVNVVRQIDKGAKNVDALLGLQSEFGVASLGVVNNLKTLMKKIA